MDRSATVNESNGLATPAAANWRRWIAPLLVLLLLALPRLASAGYVVERGDVLEVGVLGAPALHRRVAVDPGGRISLPIIGDFDVAGLSLSQLRAKLRHLLIVKDVARDPQVTVTVSQYRPIYVTGDVTKPGAYSYRIGMNVRDAVAAAGGYDLLHLRGRNLMLEAADAGREYDETTVQIAKEAARIARLQAELRDETELSHHLAADSVVNARVLKEILPFEQQQLLTDSQDAAHQKAYLARMIKQTNSELSTLQSGQKTSRAAVEQERKNLARARLLRQRGLMPIARVEDRERAVAASENQLVDITARTDRARKDLEEFTRKLQSYDAQRRIKLLGDLRDAVARMAAARYRLEAASEKVGYTRAIEQRRAAGTGAKMPTITIYRQSSGKPQRIEATASTSLLPGDNVQITSKYDLTRLTAGSQADGRDVRPSSDFAGGSAVDRSSVFRPTAPVGAHTGREFSQSERTGQQSLSRRAVDTMR